MLRQYYLDQPNEVTLETATVCNARCTFCPYPTLERVGTKMSDELIDRLIGEMAKFKEPFIFAPFKLNDPLLDKRIFGICEKFNTKVPHGRLRLFTNGSPLTPQTIEKIGRIKNLEHLWVSLNSVDPEEYEKLMGLNFEQTTKKLDYLHSLENFPHPVMLSCVGWPGTEFREYCAKRWPKFGSFAITKTSWLGFTDSQRQDVPDAPCSRWFELSIMSDGVVSLCCQDAEGKFPIGDAKTQSLLDIYNNPAWRERRRYLMSRHEVPVCQTCTYG